MDRKKDKKWGSDIIRTKISRQPYILENRTWRDLRFAEWLFILIALISILISIGFSIYQLIVSIIDFDQRFIFPVLVILNNIFSAYFLWNGVMEELPFKLLIQLTIKTLVWVFDLIFYLMPSKEAATSEETEIQLEVRQIRFYISTAMLFLTLTSGGFVIYQYWSSNIAIFRAVGTEPKYVRLCRMWNFCHSMILFDAVMFVTVLFHLCNIPYFIDTYSTYYLVPLWLLAISGYVLLGIKAIEKESRMLTYAFYVASHFQPIFIIFMLVKSSRGSLGLLLYVSLYVNSLTMFLVHIGLLVSLVRLQNSYGMGLKQAAAREEERKQLLTTADNLSGKGIQSIQMTQLANGNERQPPTETEL